MTYEVNEILYEKPWGNPQKGGTRYVMHVTASDGKVFKFVSWFGHKPEIGENLEGNLVTKKNGEYTNHTLNEPRKESSVDSCEMGTIKVGIDIAPIFAAIYSVHGSDDIKVKEELSKWATYLKAEFGG